MPLPNILNGNGGGLCSNDCRGMEERAKRLFNIYGDKYGTGFAGNVWDKEAISPNLMTMQGGEQRTVDYGKQTESENKKADT